MIEIMMVIIKVNLDWGYNIWIVIWELCIFWIVSGIGFFVDIVML